MKRKIKKFKPVFDQLSHNRYNRHIPIDVSYFTTKMTPQTAYLLGFIWGDGYVSKTRNCVRIVINNEDALSLLPIIQSAGDWVIYQHDNKLVGFDSGYPAFRDFLAKNDFCYKSYKDPTKILKIIRQHNLEHMFWLGLIDADGCFYYGEKRKYRQFSINSTFEYPWIELKKLFKRLNITHYSHKQKYHKNNISKYSIIRIIHRGDLDKLGKYIYQNRTIGFDRKFLKYQQCILGINNKTS